MSTERQLPLWLDNLMGLVTNPKVLAMVAAGFGLGGGAGTLLADNSGVTPHQADSIAKKNDQPQIDKLNRMDSAMIRIYFRQDVQMTEDEKHRADSLMRAALKNINYGGSL